jgi:DNA-binding LytR/AlgR family response regulator
MKIGICEDEIVEIEYIKKLIKSWGDEKKSVCFIESFYSAEEFLFKYETGNPFDLLILDIQMKEINGMELAKKVRAMDINVKIIFLTGIKDYVFEGYEVGAARYILKPLKEKDFFKTLDTISKELKESAHNYFVFSYEGENIKVSYEEIIKIEVDGHYVNMLTIDNECRWKESLLKMKERLESKVFVMANRSAMVNVMHIEKITKNDCIMCGNIVVPISRNNYKDVNEAFINYYM